jgi:formylglycine-generating enzyme required for sulfatase activity
MRRRAFTIIVAVAVGLAALAWGLARLAHVDPTIGVARARAADPPTTMPAATPVGPRLRCEVGDARISFTASKTVAGVSANVGGGWSRKLGSKISGWAEADPTTWRLTGAEVEVDIASLWSEHEMLTRNIIACGFFDVAAHPRATFAVRAVRPVIAAEPDAAQHELDVDLAINGISRRLVIPAQIRCDAAGLQCDSLFSTDRRSFAVAMRNPGIYSLIGDDAISGDVVMRISLKAAWPGSRVEAEVNTPNTESAAISSPTSLPGTMSVTIPSSQIRFDLVLMPPDAGAQAVYLGANEVTWEEYLPWALCHDLGDDEVAAEQRALLQRPSKPYVSVDRGFGTQGRPALGMTRLSAERYCAWLSAATGRRFRLPSEAEWRRAWLRSGAGDAAPDPAWAASHAAWKGNSIPAGKRWNSPMPVRSLAADAGGLWDLAGNTAEWVVPADGSLVVCGGHYLSELAELGGAGRLVHDPDEWSANDPGDPKSAWWFTDAPWVGFRVACDP